MSTLWILRFEANDYDQHGEYFVAAWRKKPTVEQIIKVEQFAENEEDGFLEPMAKRLVEIGDTETFNSHFTYDLVEVTEGA